MENTSKLLSLGEIVITPEALERVDMEDVSTALVRHKAGDWGDISAEDAKANNDALVTGCRILSAYTDRRSAKFWIITEADRSATTVLLPSDY